MMRSGKYAEHAAPAAEAGADAGAKKQRAAAGGREGVTPKQAGEELEKAHSALEHVDDATTDQPEVEEKMEALAQSLQRDETRSPEEVCSDAAAAAAFAGCETVLLLPADVVC